MTPQILMFIIKLVAGGIVAFLAIYLMSKNRDGEWMAIVLGFLFSYAALVFDLLIELGIVIKPDYNLMGIPITDYICTLVPDIFFAIGLLLMILKSRKR
ncbi:MAG: hypothetical protein K6A89_02870 [Treponema sp.]|nr:hypothetical protein [Treponema sp.]